MRIGIDLGGTKTEIIALNVDNGKELYRHRVPTPRGDYQATLQNMADMVHQAEKTLGQKGTVGIGIPGTICSQTNNVKNANSTWLNGNPLAADMAKLLDREVKVENDANCLAVSEATDGAGAGHKTVFAVIIGTGCGAGISIDGKPLTGINGIGGEWGHNPLPFPKAYSPDDNPLKQETLDFFEGAGRQNIGEIYSKKNHPEFYTSNKDEIEYPGLPCYCGSRGCIETWISGTGFKNDYIRINDEEISTHDIIARAGKGDEKCLKALDRYCERVSKSLAHVIDIMDPDIIVLGGGMSNVQKLYTEIPKRWDKYIFSDSVHTKLAKSMHGDSSGVRGAAWLWG